MHHDSGGGYQTPAPILGSYGRAVPGKCRVEMARVPVAIPGVPTGQSLHFSVLGCGPRISSCFLLPSVYGPSASVWYKHYPSRPLGGAQSLAFLWLWRCQEGQRPAPSLAPSWIPFTAPGPFGNSWNLRGQWGLGTEARARVSRVQILLGPSPPGGLCEGLSSLGLHCHLRHVETTPSSTDGYVVADDAKP